MFMNYVLKSTVRCFMLITISFVLQMMIMKQAKSYTEPKLKVVLTSCNANFKK